MANKVILVFVVALVVQVVSSLDAVTPATRVKLQEAFRNAIHSKAQSSIEINAVTRVIEKNIDAAVRPIEKALNDLGNSIDIAKRKAKIDNIDISECVQQARTATHNFDKDSVRNCKRIPEAVKANTELGLIEKEVRRLHDLERTCAASTDQEKCVLDGIADSAKSIAAHQKQIASIMKTAKPQEADGCIKKNADKLQSDVAKITADWKDCLKKHNFVEL